MKTNKITPLNTRVKGNIIPDWDELLKKTSFEDYHVTRETIKDVTWQNNSYRAIRLNAHAEETFLTVTVDNNILVPGGTPATITGRLTYHETTQGNNEEIEPVPDQLITILDDEKEIANITTNEDGQFTYQYTGKSGTHNIKIKSAHANGFQTTTKTITIIVKYETRLEISPWYTYDLGHGETTILKATLYDSEGTPVADKPVHLMEGYRDLGTYTTDSRGEVKVLYQESSTGTPTSITVNRNPNLYENMYSIFEGVLTDNNGNNLSGKGVTLFHEYSGHYLASATTDNNGKFSIKYNPLTSSVNPHYYLAFRNSSVTNNEYNTYEPTWTALGEKEILEVPEDWDIGSYTSPTVYSEENTELGFDTDNWTGNGARVLQDNGTLLLAYGTGTGNNYLSLPSTNWKIVLDVDIDTTNNSTIQYANNKDGATFIYIDRNYNTEIRETTLVNGSHSITSTTSVDKFVTSSNTRNTLTIEREGTKIIFEYKSNDTQETVRYTREYTELIVNGWLQMLTYLGAEITVYSLVILQDGGGQLV